MAVSQRAGFTRSPNRSHEEALRRIGMCLRKTENEGLILRPSDHFEIDCCCDADFASLWGHENPLEPSVAKSQTGFVVCIPGYPGFHNSVGAQNFVVNVCRENMRWIE